MSSIKLRSIKKHEHSTDFSINFHVDLERGSGYETNVLLSSKPEGWVAEINFIDMPAQETPEEALDRLGLYLRNMAKAVKGENIKHLNVGTLFDSVYKS